MLTKLRQSGSFKSRLKTAFAVAAASAALTVAVPATSATAADSDSKSASAVACESAWTADKVYVGGDLASFEGHNWRASWWSKGDTPRDSGQWGVWVDQGACGDGGGPGPGEPGDFEVTEAQFNQMFPNRNPFYTYQGLLDALKAYPDFTNSGDATTQKREAAAFLANISHETAGLYYIVEQNQNNYPHYCDKTQPYGCPAGQAAYYGRGPIQLSWNFNYKAAGDALGIDLLNNPYLVERDPSIAMQTALWYWNTQQGPGTMTAHEAMAGGHGFGQTIWAINGALECKGGNPAQVESRINKYKQYTAILGVTPGDNLSC